MTKLLNSLVAAAIIAATTVGCNGGNNSSSTNNSQLNTIPEQGKYIGTYTHSQYGNLKSSVTVVKDNVQVVIDLEFAGESPTQLQRGTITGDFLANNKLCFSGTKSFMNKTEAVVFRDCSYSHGRFTATVEYPATSTIRTSQTLSTANSADTIDISLTSSGNLAYQYNYDDGTSATLSLGSNYDDLVVSNYIAGAMLGHLIRLHVPGISLDRDHLYGAVFAHLLQENIDTGGNYQASSQLVNINAEAENLMLAGQGGPYQLNSWDQANYSQWSWNSQTQQSVASYYGLINLVTLQRGLTPYTVAGSLAHPNGNYYSTPNGLNNKYFAPLAAAFWHYQNLVAIENANQTGGNYDMSACEKNLQSGLVADKDNILDLILNASYNSGAASRNNGTTAVEAYILACQTNNFNLIETTLTNNSLTSTDYLNQAGINSTTFSTPVSQGGGYPFYGNYARQLRLSVDEINGNTNVNPLPTSVSAVDQVLPLSLIQSVFVNQMQTLSYLASDGSYAPISAAQATNAISSAITLLNTGGQSLFRLNESNDRKLFFDILDQALNNLKTSVSNPNFKDFTATTQSDLN